MKPINTKLEKLLTPHEVVLLLKFSIYPFLNRQQARFLGSWCPKRRNGHKMNYRNGFSFFSNLIYRMSDTLY